MPDLMTPNDFGPIYSETDRSRFPVEPWNTAINAIFFFILVYFAVQTRLDYKRYPLIVAGLPILLVGFVGGTVFHATRSNSLWLILDFLPILILAGMTALYFWKRLAGSIFKAVLFVVIPVGAIRMIGAAVLPRHFFISLSYGTLALALLIPIFICSFREGAREMLLLIGALLIFAVALLCRILDSVLGTSILPMGTHFLWHLFGGVSVFLLMKFILVNRFGSSRSD